MKNQKGISLIALIITIIVIVILAAVVISTSLNAPKSAQFASWCTKLGGIQDQVTMAYVEAFTAELAKGTAEEAAKTAALAKIAPVSDGQNKIANGDYGTDDANYIVNPTDLMVYWTTGYAYEGATYYNASKTSM